jgi:uncharacterized membrane protein
MIIAVLSLIGLFIAVYLYLYKVGIVGSMSCKIGGCEKVNNSPWAMFLGLPVALWGIVYYVGLFGVSLASTFEQFADDARFAKLLLLFTSAGMLFSAYLTALELLVIHAVCQYCVVSAILVCIMFGLSIVEMRAPRTAD